MPNTTAGEHIRIGVDVGGTNTDVILSSADGESVHKQPTTDDPSKSTAEGLTAICEQSGVDPGAVGQILHGTTVGTNALIEHEGAETGMLTTEGFRDVLHIGRHRKPHNFSLQQTVPWQENPIVERRHRKEIPERIQPPGEVTTPLDEAAVKRATAELAEDGIESIAVCYLHSYLDPSHERRTKELIQETHPEMAVSTSSEVVSQFREFERFTTTAINARLEPVMTTYLQRLQRRLEERGFDCEVLIMQSNGGLASLDRVQERPVTTLISGPAAGVLSAEFEGQQADTEKLITFDMGGTSADISVYPGSVLERDPRDSKVGGYPTIVPMLDVETIGSGGGSIAWLDRAKGFNVGPKSAGANPGPACYGRGNEEPTVTDAQVVLGRIDPDRFLGGGLDIDEGAARDAIRSKLTEPMNQERFATPEKAALAVLEVANTNMYRAIREQTVQRGYDPREYTLVAFGGAGPMHATAVAEELDISEILVPPAPGIASARGLLTGEVKYDYQTTISQRLESVDANRITEQFEELERLAERQLDADEILGADRSFRRSVDCLYEGQGYELNIGFDAASGEWRSQLRDRFERKHEAEYGHYFEADPIELLNIRVTATGEVGAYESPEPPESESVDDALTGRDDVVFGTSAEPSRREVPKYERRLLPAGERIDGPVVIYQPDSTVVVEPGWTATVRPNRTLALRR
jgi:N-methylhydantoinase A